MGKSADRKNGVVYHCIPVTPVGDFIIPSDKYGGNVITEDIRLKFNMASDIKTPLIFAATHITKAMAFGLQGGLQEKFLCCSIEGSNGEMVLGCDREKMMARVRDITIYEIPDKDFVILNERERQNISAKPIPFSDVKVVYQAKNAEDLMRGGLQILAFNESMKELNDSKDLHRIENAQGDAFYKVLGEMVREGKIIWENKERGINPDAILAQKINVALKQHQPNVSKNLNKPKL